MVINHSFKLLLSKVLVISTLAVMINFDLDAQDCGPDVPHFEVDLSSQPDAVFSSPMIIRQGNCCGTTNPDRCIAFTITLHEDAEGILFDVCDGAAPSGSLYYQIGCGPQHPVGEVLCLDGPGPHYLTFCKPGNNENVYCITSVPAPSAGPAQIASEGCTAEISATGYDPATVTWTSVFPGPPGEFDDQLSCTNCLSSTVTAPINFPPYVDYMICGLAVGGCSSLIICDTVRVHFVSNLDVSIAPEEPAICFGSTGTEVTASGVGGFPPYTFTWSNGTSGATTWIEEPGIYSVEITDDSGCPPASYEFEVTEYDLPLEVNAGADILACSASEDVQLNGYFEGMESAVWEGGNGTFTPNRNDPLAAYSPTAAEIENGSLQLILALYPLGSCPPAFDTLNIQFSTFEATVLTESNSISCFGLTDGNIALAADGNGQPFNIEWSDPILSGWTVDNLSSGTYTATITDSIGCSAEYIFDITEPGPLELQVAELGNVSCHDGNDGNVNLFVTGGTPEYTFLWPDNIDEGSGAENLSPGNYTVSVADANECTTEITFEITAPDPLTITVEADSTMCYGEDLDISATVTGGTGDYTYHWSENLSDAAEHTVSPEVTTTYTVFATDENGCETAAIELPVEVVSMDENLLSLNPGEPICAGESTAISVFYLGAHPPYSYSWSHGLPAVSGPHDVSPDETTTYSVTVSDFCGNEVTGEVTVVVHPLPELSLQNVDDVTCYGLNNGTASVSVASGTPGYQYMWSGSESTSHSVNDLAPGHHQVTVSDYHECLDSLQFPIAEPAPLTITASTDTLVCLGDAVLLSANASGGIGGYTYNWGHSDDENAEQPVNISSNSTFTVQAMDENGCVSETEVLEVNVITMTTDLLTTISGGPACLGESTTVAAQYSGAQPPYSYQWSNGLPSTPGPHVVSPTESFTYSVTVTDQCGNSVVGDVPVEILPLPVVDLPSMLAEGCEDLRVTFTDTINDVSNHNWVWTIDDDHHFTGNTLNYVFTEPGLHTVDLSVTSFDGCETASANSSLVMVKPSPTAAFTANPWEMEINEPEVTFTDQSEGNETWLWHFGDNNHSSLQNPVYTYSDTGTYLVTLIVENEHQCTDSVSRYILVKPSYNIIIPNAFTPTDNNNGYYDPTNPNNDIFYPFADYVQEFRMTIFNRWGEIIFESTEMNRGWNGWYRGEPCAQDVYVYKIEFVFSDGAEITKVGDITLFR